MSYLKNRIIRFRRPLFCIVLLAVVVTFALFISKTTGYGYGEGGQPVYLSVKLSADTEKRLRDGWQKYRYNEYLSELISLRRTLPDFRHNLCKTPGRYLTSLPQTSVIMPFRNEAWSVLLRAVHSILERSPEHLLKEIILVDDVSDMVHLKTQLDDYMVAYPKVKILRPSTRLGLVRARLLGAKYATAPVLTFLDSQIECADGWLEPVLDRIAQNSQVLVSPTTDFIDMNTFGFSTNKDSLVPAFLWNLIAEFMPLPEREKIRRKNPAESVRTPAIIGCMFSIDRTYFEKLGAFDAGLDIWGAENIELSLKVWMCGGTVEILPCSHVGHIFRDLSFQKIQFSKIVKRNLVRLAKVWLDDYAKYYYETLGDEIVEYGDVSSNLELRKNLKCKSFKWYLENVFPELQIPCEAIMSGEVRNFGINETYCLDTPYSNVNYDKAGIYPCGGHYENQFREITSNQKWRYCKTGQIQRWGKCLGYTGSEIHVHWCLGNDRDQKWLYEPEKKLIRLMDSEETLCLAISKDKKNELLMEICNSQLPEQQWAMKNYDATPVITAGQVEE